MEKPPKHLVPYGIAGTGKSTLVASMPTPQFIAMFDPIGKETPYTDGLFVDTYEGLEIAQQPTLISTANGLIALPTWDCFLEEKCETLVRRIVWFQDQDNTNPTAYENYSILQPTLVKIIQRLGIKTLALDSVTTLCRCLHAAAVKGDFGPPTEKSERGFAGLATPELEWVNQFISSLPINTAVICHSDYDRDPNRSPELPQISVHAYGKMRQKLLITTGDVYRAFKQNGDFLVSVEADSLHAGNNSMKLKGTFPNDWKEIIKADQTKVTFVQRKRGD